MVHKTLFFSYERNEPIGPKLVYLNKNPPSRVTETKCSRDAFRNQLHELSKQPILKNKTFFKKELSMKVIHDREAPD